MLTLIKNAQVYSPHALGVRDVLITGNTIANVEEGIELAGKHVEVVDAEGRWLIPGLVDPLTHPAGGGGEGGFGNRTRELEAEEFISVGITTPVGALGTDSIARSLETLYGQVMSLRANGLSACMFSGSYRVPAETLTGEIARDLVLIEPVIGLGEVAIADHRSSQPTAEEFRRLAAEVHLGGTISGKGGVLFIHVGDGESRLDLVESAMYGSDLPRRLFYPTHCNRRGELLEQAIAHANKGGYIDFTVSTTPELIEAGEVPALDGLRQAIDAGVPAGNLTFSSDAGGSLPHYRNGELVGLKAATPGSLLELLRTAADGQAAPPTEVLAALTCNPADALNLPLKGRIQPGADADLLLLDPAGAQLNDVFCLGRRLLRNGHIQIHTSRHTQD